MFRPLRVDGSLKRSACDRRQGDAHDHLARTTVGSMQRIFRTRSLCLRRQDCRRQSYKKQKGQIAHGTPRNPLILPENGAPKTEFKGQEKTLWSDFGSSLATISWLLPGNCHQERQVLARGICLSAARSRCLLPLKQSS